jgi:hypothetical protein
MSKGFLTEQAKDFADGLHTRRSALERELAAIETKKLETELQLDAAKLAYDRFATFDPEIAGNLQCPKCWVYDGKRASVRAVPGTATEDAFVCNLCGYEYWFRFR